MHMTLRDVYLVIDTDQKVKKDNVDLQEYIAWRNGYYFMQALCTTVGNWLCKPNEPFEYPDNPIVHETEEQRIEKELKKMIDAEEAYIAMHKSHGLQVQTIAE